MSADPVRDGPAEDEHICGMGLFRQGSLEKVRELLNPGPAPAPSKMWPAFDRRMCSPALRVITCGLPPLCPVMMAPAGPARWAFSSALTG